MDDFWCQLGAKMGAKTLKNEVPELFKICVAAQFLNTLDFWDVYIYIYTYTFVNTYIHTTRHMIALTLRTCVQHLDVYECERMHVYEEESSHTVNALHVPYFTGLCWTCFFNFFFTCFRLSIFDAF